MGRPPRHTSRQVSRRSTRCLATAHRDRRLQTTTS